MSNTIYNTQQYVRFSLDEFIAILLTSLGAAAAVSMRDLLFERFGNLESIIALAITFVFTFFVILVSIYVCKITAVKFGHVLEYRAHVPGLAIGLAITVISAGYLPFVLPGGFISDMPERLRVGKFLGYRRGWEIGFIAATFPLVLVLFLTVFSPLYISTHADLYLRMMGVCALLAIYACIPVPLFNTQNKGRALEWWRYMRGSSFGLDVIYGSVSWYYILVFTVVVFSILAYIMTKLDIRAGFTVFAITLIMAAIGLYVYPQFFKHQK